MLYGIPLKTIIQTIGILALVGLILHVGCQAKKLATVKEELKAQYGETKKCNDSVASLEGALSKQTTIAEENAIVAREAKALYDALAAREPETVVIPRDRIIEVIRPGDCDRAALDAWDLLNGGNASWNATPEIDWRSYYASVPASAWEGAVPRLNALASTPVVRTFELYVTPSRFQTLDLRSTDQGAWISGWITSLE